MMIFFFNSISSQKTACWNPTRVSEPQRIDLYLQEAMDQAENKVSARVSGGVKHNEVSPLLKAKLY